MNRVNSPHPNPLRFLKFTASALVGLALAAPGTGCASKTPKSAFVPASAESLATFGDADLRLTRFIADGKTVALDAAPVTLRFGEGGKIGGRSAVNRYFGAYTLGTNGSLAWAPGGIGMTRMAGPEAAMQLESVYGQTLTRTSQLLTSPGGVRFQNADASNLLEFAR